MKRIPKPQSEEFTFNPKLVGKRIENELKEKNMKKKELAQMLDVSPQSVSGYIDGKAITIETLYAIAKALNTSLDSLVGIDLESKCDNPASAISEMTGLTYDAAKRLCDDSFSAEQKEILSYALESEMLNKLLSSANHYFSLQILEAEDETGAAIISAIKSETGYEFSDYFCDFDIDSKATVQDPDTLDMHYDMSQLSPAERILDAFTSQTLEQMSERIEYNSNAEAYAMLRAYNEIVRRSCKRIISEKYKYFYDIGSECLNIIENNTSTAIFVRTCNDDLFMNEEERKKKLQSLKNMYSEIEPACRKLSGEVGKIVKNTLSERMK